MLGAVLKGTANAIGGGARRIATDKLLNRKKKTDARRAAAQNVMGEEQGADVKGGALAVIPKSPLVPSPGGDIVKYSGDEQQSGGDNLEGTVLRIKTSVIEVEKLLANSVGLQEKQLDDQRKAREAAQQAAAEGDLEKKKPKGIKVKGPKIKMPGKGFLGSIMDFFANILFGWVMVRLVEWGPKLKGLIMFLGKAADFLLNFAGFILNGLVTLVDWGYKLVDMGRSLVKGVFGEEGAKKFDTFMTNIKDLIQGFLLWKIIGEKIFKALVQNIKNTFNVIKGIFEKAGKFLNWLTRGKAGNLAKNVLGKGKNLLGKIGKFGGKAGKSIVTKVGAKVGGLAAKIFGPAAKVVAPAIKGAMTTVKGFFGKIPIIGPIIVGLVSLLSGEPLGQALFKTFGAAIGGMLGTFIPIPFIGTLIGEALGVFVGDLLYHLIVKRDPKAAFKMLKDTIMGIFKGGKAIFNWFAGGFSRFYQGIPKLKIPDFPKDPPKWIPGWVPRKKALWNILTGGIKLVIGPLSLLMGKEIPILPWLINPANTVPLLIKSFFPPGGSDSGGGSLSMGGSSSGMSSGSGSGGGEKSEEEKKEEKKKKWEEKKKRMEEEKKKKQEERKAKIGEIKSKVGGFFGKIGQGIKNVGGAIMSKHPAVMAAKAIKSKISSSSGKISSSSGKTSSANTQKRTRLKDDPRVKALKEQVNSSPPTINKPNNSFSNMINSVSKKTEYEELEPVIVTVPVLVKSGGGVVNQQSSSTTVASTGGGSGNDPYEVLDFQG